MKQTPYPRTGRPKPCFVVLRKKHYIYDLAGEVTNADAVFMAFCRDEDDSLNLRRGLETFPTLIGIPRDAVMRCVF